jgi:hypothetical protein
MNGHLAARIVRALTALERAAVGNQSDPEVQEALRESGLLREELGGPPGRTMLVRTMDQIDTETQLGGWMKERIQRIAPPYVGTRIEVSNHEGQCGRTTVLWNRERPTAVTVAVRDGLNWTYGFGADIAGGG